jgi:cytochrome c oxidase subunit 3
MPTDLVRERPARGTRPGGPGRRDGAGPRRRGDGGGGGGGAQARWASPMAALVAVGAVLAAVVMLFIAFTSAYLARRQEAGWTPIALPGVLWLNTAVLLASSGTLEWARGRIARGDQAGLRQGLGWTAGLGAAFVLGQLAAWRQLTAQGVYLVSNPHSSFFYLLTGAHGLHLLGGLAALAVVLLRASRGRYTAEDHTGVSVCALYWHFMDGLWLYLFALLFWI